MKNVSVSHVLKDTMIAGYLGMVRLEKNRERAGMTLQNLLLSNHFSEIR